jgi:hypothetical protein
MILLVGDSNLRNVVEENQKAISTKLNDEIVFEQAGTNESLKTILEASTTEYNQVVIATLLNEITKLGKAVKTRDDIINTVTKQQAEIVAKHAELHPNTRYIVLPPFMRFEPPWLPDKLRVIQLHLKDHLEQTGKSNINYGVPVEITDKDLKPDNVHLNEAGKEKLLRSLIGTPSPSPRPSINASPPISNWANTPLTRARSKRTRQATNESDSDEEVVCKKARDNDYSAIILAKLNQMTDEMREERAKAAERADHLVAQLNINIQTTTNNAKKIEELSKSQETFNSTVASLREDLDVVENENMRSIIIIRKLTTDKIIPKTKSEMNTLLKELASDLVAKLGGNAAMIKFVTMAYSEVDQTKQNNRKNQVPTFKIGFNNKDDAITFKEKGTKAAKDKDSEIHKVVFAYQQCSATRIRCTIMWAIANKLKADGQEAWVNAATSKPKLQVKGDKKYPTDYTFVAAIDKYQHLLKDGDLKDASLQAKKFFKGQCKQLFVVLKD